MCVKCGVDYDKFGVYGLYQYMMDAFFRHAFDLDIWDRKNQIYLDPYPQAIIED